MANEFEFIYTYIYKCVCVSVGTIMCCWLLIVMYIPMCVIECHSFARVIVCHSLYINRENVLFVYEYVYVYRV